MKTVTFALATLTAVSLAASSAASAKTVRFSGCTFRGVETGCLMVRAGTTVYNISAARPRPGLNRAISGRGDVFTGPTTCMQGTTLRNIRWNYTKMKCPKSGRRPS